MKTPEQIVAAITADIRERGTLGALNLDGATPLLDIVAAAALRAVEADRAQRPVRELDVVFDAAPGAETGRFVEVEDLDGASVNVGTWIDRGNGDWALRLEVRL